MISKELFLSTLSFIRDLEKKQDNFMSALEELSPHTYCDCFLYSDAITKIISILTEALHDKSELIIYYLYEFPSLSEVSKVEQINRTPEVSSDEAVYNYLVEHYDDKE